MSGVTVAVSIDTEEDDWGSYAFEGERTNNIAHLPELQDLFDRWGARPTYLVNRAPLMSAESTAVLGALSQRDDVEIGAHCHPWNTPPFTGEGSERSMMCSLTHDENRAKLAEVVGRLRSELGVTPRTFRAGRWGLGPTVGTALLAEGFEIDCSVSPFVDWSDIGGPDFTRAPHLPYRFRPDRPLLPDPGGELIQIPTTVGFMGGAHSLAARARVFLRRSALRPLRVIGLLDRMGLLARRWLSPETSSGATMVRLVDSMVVSGAPFVQVTFHSCTLLPGATPFVRDAEDRRRFLKALDTVLAHCHRSGHGFATLGECPSLLGGGLDVRSSARGDAAD